MNNKYLTIKQTDNINTINLNEGELCLEKLTDSVYIKNNTNNIKLNSSFSLPSGMIVAFYGSTIPDGWTICDGTNNTPDLRSRFILGSSTTYPVNTIGGNSTKTLNINELPSHSHKTTASPFNAFYVGGIGQIGGTGTSSYFADLNNINTSAVGGNQSFSILNPYYSLRYIMKI